MSPSVQAAGLSPAVSAPAPKRGRPKGRKNGASKSTVVLPASLNETGDAAQPEATNTARQASLVNQPPRKRGRPKGSKNTPLGEQRPVTVSLEPPDKKSHDICFVINVAAERCSRCDTDPLPPSLIRSNWASTPGSDQGSVLCVCQVAAQ